MLTSLLSTPSLRRSAVDYVSQIPARWEGDCFIFGIRVIIQKLYSVAPKVEFPMILLESWGGRDTCNIFMYMNMCIYEGMCGNMCFLEGISWWPAVQRIFCHDPTPLLFFFFGSATNFADGRREFITEVMRYIIVLQHQCQRS